MPIKEVRKLTPQASDEFSGQKLQPQWEWNYQPRADKWSLTERKDWLRLYAFKPLEAGNLLKAGNIITQRTMRTKQNEVVVKLNLSGMAEGQEAGFTHFSSPNYSAVGVVCKGKIKTLVYKLKDVSAESLVLKSNRLWLKSTWGLDGLSQYFYSLDGKIFVVFGRPYQLKWGSYRGDRLGIYSYNNLADAGFLDVDYFHYHY